MRLFWAPSATLALLLLASAPLSRAQDCSTFFSSIADNLETFPTFVLYTNPTTTSELAAVNTVLLTVQWTENVFGTPTVDPESDSSYLEGIVEASSMEIEIISSLEGLTDYSNDWAGSPKTDLSLIYNFPVIDESLNLSSCTIRFLFPLEDVNTATPTTDLLEYSSSLREDFPLSLAIPYLQVIVQDLDGTSPNNLLTASFDADCPLTTTDEQYDGQGKDVTMTFMLEQKLDYDTMLDSNLICQVTITDGGTNPGPKSTSLTITIAVEGFEDEPPVFDNSLYTSTLDSQQASPEPLSIQPAAINAVDADKDGSPITYTMTSSDIDGPEWDNYFAIDVSTADVTVVQDIPGSMLADYSVHFLLTAADGNNNMDTSILEIILPTATTNVTSTSPPGTTPTPGNSSPTTPDGSSSTPATAAESTEQPATTAITTADGSSTDTPTTPGTTTIGSSTDSPDTTVYPPSTDPSATTPPPTIPTTIAPEYEYMFERAAYNFELYPTSRVAGSLKVVRADKPDEYTENVSYKWADSASNGTEYFTLDASSGEVLIVEQPELGFYALKATAVVNGDSSDTISTDVYIEVLKPGSCDDVFIEYGVIFEDISENTVAGNDIATVQTQNGNEADFCIVGVRPGNLTDSFDVDESGHLILAKTLDADQMPIGERSIAVWIKALIEGEQCPSDVGDIDRSEVIVFLNVVDENDEAPTIVQPSANIQVGYPSNKALQEVVGPVVNIEVQDVDTVGELEFSLTGDNSNLFILEETTGNLYLTDPSSCSDSCQVTVTVSDGVNADDQRSITVLPLDTDKIYDITFSSMTTSEIEAEIQQLSQTSKLDLHLLYSSVAQSDEETDDARVVGRLKTSSRRRRKRETRSLRDGSWVSVAHIYGFDDEGNYVSLEDLNSALPDDEKASIFSEDETFNPPEATDITGYQVAVGILGALLALILVAAVVGFFWYRKKKQQTPHESNQLNTLAAAYPNHAFNTEMSEIARDNGSSTSHDSDSRHVSILSPTNEVENNPNPTTPEEDHYEEPINTAPLDKPEYPYKAAAGATAAGIERKTSQHSLGGLHRIDPGPSPDGTKSSPYLTGSEGDFQASRSTEDETVDSFTAYKGGPKPEDSPKSIKVNMSYSPVYKESHVSFGNTSEIVDNDSRSRAESGTSSKKSVNGYGVSVRVKKEPPDLSATSPAKPIMKKKSVTAEVHHEPEAPVVPGTFAKLQSSPTVKKKKKTKTSISSDDENSKTKGGQSDGAISDSEMKKSVAFKVLVHQKEIERINDNDESGTENF